MVRSQIQLAFGIISSLRVLPVYKMNCLCSILFWDKFLDLYTDIYGTMSAPEFAHNSDPISDIYIKYCIYWAGVTPEVEFTPGSGTQLLADSASLDLCTSDCDNPTVSTMLSLEVNRAEEQCERDMYSIQAQRRLCGMYWLWSSSICTVYRHSAGCVVCTVYRHSAGCVVCTGYDMYSIQAQRRLCGMYWLWYVQYTGTAQVVWYVLVMIIFY